MGLCQADGCHAPALMGWQRHAAPTERAAHLLASATHRVEIERARIEQRHKVRAGQHEAAVKVMVAEARRTGLPVPREVALLPPEPVLPSLSDVQPDPDTGEPILIHVLACPDHAINLDQAALAHQPDCGAPGAAGCTCEPGPYPNAHSQNAAATEELLTLPTGWRLPKHLID